MDDNYSSGINNINNRSSSHWIIILVAICFLFACVYGIKQTNLVQNILPKQKTIDFMQHDQFIKKQGIRDTYDSFYFYNYDLLNRTQDRVQYEILQFMKTNPLSRESRILDVGSGTGVFLQELSQYNFIAEGVDISPDCVLQTRTIYPNVNVKCGDALDAKLFSSKQFSHITCFYLTLYEIQDKTRFFTNIYAWLKPGGYFIIHVVDPDQFSMITPSATVRPDLVQQFSHQRITESTVSFPSYVYTLSYSPNESGDWMITETFVDKQSHKRRHNERPFYSVKKTQVIQLALEVGLTMHSEVSYRAITGDKSQWIITFKK
jgi:SAM-dependent methyltransferase